MAIAIALTILIGVIASVAFVHAKLAGEDLSIYDTGAPTTFDADPNSDGQQAVKVYLQENFIKPAQAKTSRAEKLARKREMFEAIGHRRDFGCEFQPATYTHDGVTITGEWTLVEGCDTSRRLLYLHGGANTVGSAVSHRPIISNIAKRTGCAVFAPNYRLMPENARLDAIRDVRAAYEWICVNGPDGESAAASVAIGGDSAGANLTLSLINWVRDEKKRKADAAFVISPATDSTCSSPSIKNNFETDLMLRPLAAPLLKMPRPLLLASIWALNRMAPTDPRISPIFADLSNLPPTLIHISAAEMLYDDARRYAEKARRAGTAVTLQSWAHMAHVWHAFDQMLPEAHHAFDEIAAFLHENGAAPRQTRLHI